MPYIARLPPQTKFIVLTDRQSISTCTKNVFKHQISNTSYMLQISGCIVKTI